MGLCQFVETRGQFGFLGFGVGGVFSEARLLGRATERLGVGIARGADRTQLDADGDDEVRGGQGGEGRMGLDGGAKKIFGDLATTDLGDLGDRGDHGSGDGGDQGRVVADLAASADAELLDGRDKKIKGRTSGVNFLTIVHSGADFASLRVSRAGRILPRTTATTREYYFLLKAGVQRRIEVRDWRVEGRRVGLGGRVKF